MCPGMEEAEQFTSVEDRTQEGPVREMAALHQVGVVTYDRVAWGKVTREGSIILPAAWAAEKMCRAT